MIEINRKKTRKKILKVLFWWVLPFLVFISFANYFELSPKSEFIGAFCVLFCYLGFLGILFKYYDRLQLAFFHKMFALGVLFYYPTRILIDSLVVSLFLWPANLFDMIEMAILIFAFISWINRIFELIPNFWRFLLVNALFTLSLLSLLVTPKYLDSQKFWQTPYGFFLEFKPPLSIHEGISEFKNDFKDFK